MRYIEKRLANTVKPDVLGAPDILLMLTDELAVGDNLSGRLTLIVRMEGFVPYEEDIVVDTTSELQRYVELDLAGE